MKKELKYYGLHSCITLWKKRPNDIIRVYITESNVKIMSSLLKWCAQQKKAYHIVPVEELNRITDSIHHEGIAVLAKEREESTLPSNLPKAPLIYFDGVENPHNFGAIIRSAAHFGSPYLLGEKGKLPPLSPSAYRIAKGGAESLQIIYLNDPIKTLRNLKDKGFTLISTSSHKGASLYASTLPEKAIFILGAESTGVTKELNKLSSLFINIPGTGEVESLNVSVAAALLLGEYRRQHPL